MKTMIPEIQNRGEPEESVDGKNDERDGWGIESFDISADSKAIAWW